MANAAAAPGKLYGIIQMPAALDAINHANTAARHPLYQAIFQLQMDPRPEEREAADEYGAGLSSLIVHTTNPPYRITYQIDDAQFRVVIIAVSEARWKQ